MKQNIQIKQAAQKLFNRFGYQISRFQDPIKYPFIDVLELIAQSCTQAGSDFFFIQIGAADGVSEDPINYLIKKHHWSGVLVEPQPLSFKQLVENYRGEEKLIFENALIGSEDGLATLYAVPDQGEKFHCWVYQCASQDRNTVLRSLQIFKETVEPGIPSNYDSLIQEIQVPSMTIRRLISKHQIKSVDLLVLDTMGYDFEIIKLFPFESIKPTIIHFEHNTLSFTDQANCFKYLSELGYSFASVAVDTVAWLNAPTRIGHYTFNYS